MTRKWKSLLKGRKKTRILFLLASVLSALVFSLASCGLENYAYLEPPLNVKNTGNVLHFENNTKNDAALFIGFKVLYRFYASEDAGETDRDKVEAYYANDPTSIYSKLTTTLGYKTLMIGTGSDVLKIASDDKNTAFGIDIDFSQPDIGVPIGFTETTVSTTPDIGTPTYVYRHVYDSNNNPLNFSTEDLTEGDPDLKSGQYDLNGATTYLQCYVIAYGYDWDEYSDIYSKPVWFDGDLIALTVTSE